MSLGSISSVRTTLPSSYFLWLSRYVKTVDSPFLMKVMDPPWVLLSGEEEKGCWLWETPHLASRMGSFECDEDENVVKKARSKKKQVYVKERLLKGAPTLAENRHSPPPIRVIAGVKLNHYHRALSICCCLPSLICLSCCRRRHQLPGGDEDTTGVATSRSPPPDWLGIAARFVVCRPTKCEERGREALEQN
nr:E3 ubiquitin-protein ligase ORTHRUS 2-like [Ipomoea batatas]